MFGLHYLIPRMSLVDNNPLPGTTTPLDSTAPTSIADPIVRDDAQSPEEEFHVQPLSKASRSVAGSAMELGTTLELIKAGGDAPVVGIAPKREKSNASRKSGREQSTLSKKEKSSASIGSQGKKKKKEGKSSAPIGSAGATKKEKSSASLKSSEKADDSTAIESTSSASVGKAIVKKKKFKAKNTYGIHTEHHVERLTPKTKRMTMVGGIPYYREVGDIKDIVAVHETENQNYMINGHLMAGVGFVPKKDFDTEPATLDELNPPLEYMPYEKPAPELKFINTRDFVMPKGRGGMKPKDTSYIKKHPKGWNEETINPDAWTPLEETYYRNDGRYHEFRPTEKFIKPKDWRILHPDEPHPSKKGIFVLKALEDLRTTKGTSATQRLAITNTSGQKVYKSTKPRTGKEPRKKSSRSTSAGSTKSGKSSAGDAGAPGATASGEGGSAFMTQADEGAGSGGDAGGDGTGAVSTVPPMIDADDLHLPPPALISTTPLEQALIQVDQTWTPHKIVGDRTFMHGTWGKWGKFNSDSSHRRRLPVPTPAILKRKPKFNAYKYVTKKHHQAVNAAVKRAELKAAGIYEVERPIKDRQLKGEADRHRASRIKEKPRWATRSVLVMLRDILSTEDSKLKALETQLHRASEDLARSGAQVYTLDGYRQSIQKIRRRIADLREAVAYVKKDTWLKDITRLLISSAVPLDKFLADAEGLKADGKFLIDDMPWDDM